MSGEINSVTYKDRRAIIKRLVGALRNRRFKQATADDNFLLESINSLPATQSNAVWRVVEANYYHRTQSLAAKTNAYNASRAGLDRLYEKWPNSTKHHEI